MSEVYAFIEAEKTTHGVALLCRLLKVARPSFYAWLAGEQARAARRAADDALAHEITVLHIASRCTYRVPRIHAELRRLDRRVNRKRALTLGFGHRRHLDLDGPGERSPRGDEALPRRVQSGCGRVVPVEAGSDDQVRRR
ncbi:hypothetical protein ACVWZD_000812 [Streptomyces sp. TE3672]